VFKLSRDVSDSDDLAEDARVIMVYIEIPAE